MSDAFEWDGRWPDWDLTPARPGVAQVRLNGRQFGVEVRQYRRRSVQSIRDTLATSEQADDSMYTSDAAWHRYAYSWHRGNGGHRHDFGDDQDPFRPYLSAGVDIWTRHEATLLPMFAMDGNASGTVDPDALSICMTYIGGSAAPKIWVLADSPAKTWYGTPGTPGVWTEFSTGLSGTPQTFEPYGYYMYLGTSTKIQRALIVSAPATWVDFVTSPVRTWTMVRFVGKRMFGFTSAGEVYEIDSAGTATQILAVPAVSWSWRCCFGLGNRIYIGGGDNTKSAIFMLEADATGTLYEAGMAADLPAGEELMCGVAGAGVGMIGTSQGARMVRASGDGTLEFGPLVGVVDESPIRSYRALTMIGQYVFGVNREPVDGKDCIVRFNLDEFIAPLAPAWAYDQRIHEGTVNQNSIVACGVGPASQPWLTDANYLVAVAGRHKNTSRLWVATDTGSGHVTHPSSTYPISCDYEHQGTIVSAPVFFGTNDDKRIHSVQLSGSYLLGDEGYGVDVIDGDGVVIASGDVVYDGETAARGLVLDLEAVVADAVEVRTYLRGDGSSTPRLERWRLQAFPIVPPVQEFIVPLIIHERTLTGAGQGQLRRVALQDVIDELVDAWAVKAPVEYSEGTRSWRVRIEQFELQGSKFPPDSDGIEGLFVVRLVTV